MSQKLFYRVKRFLLLIVAVSIIFYPVVEFIFLEDRLFEHPFVRIMVMVFNGIKPGIWLALVLNAISIAFQRVNDGVSRNWTSKILTNGLALIQILCFFGLSLVLANLWMIPKSLYFAGLATAIFATAFPLQKPPLPDWIWWLTLPVLFAISQHNFLLAPVAAVLFFLFPGKLPIPYARMVTLKRVVACAVAFPMLSAVMISARNIAVSDSAVQLLTTTNLYACRIDNIKRRLLVSTKHTGDSTNLLFSIDLDAPMTDQRTIKIRTVELESFALDTKNRLIYLINSNIQDKKQLEGSSRKEANLPLRLYIIDADTYKVKEIKEFFKKCTGSIKHTLIESAQRMIFYCEDDNLLSYDIATGQLQEPLRLGAFMDITGDTESGRLYLNYDRKMVLEARDAKSLEVIKRVKGPILSYRMFLSRGRRELYVPSILLCGVWVYSTPDLVFKKKISTQFGQRAFAVDEKNKLLIAGSGVTGYVDVYDLESGKRLQRHYIAKYSRNLAVDPERRHAFITTTFDGLFMLSY